VEHAAHECPVFVLVELSAGSCRWDGIGQRESGQVAVVEEPAWESDPGRASCREPGVEVGLGAVVDGPATPGEVVEETLGGSDLLPAAVADRRVESTVAIRFGAGDDVPADVASQRLLVSRVGDFVDDGGGEASKTGGVLVAVGQDTGGDEEGA